MTSKGEILIFYFIAYSSGAVIMILELVASRVIAPYAGSTIYTWTNIIGTILLSLSVGYYLGGKLADNLGRRQQYILPTLLLIASIYILLIGYFSDNILYYFFKAISDIKLQAFISTLILFAVPSTLLAAIYPYIAKICITNLRTTGATIGKIYAFSTLGSITGTYLGGYLLIPYIGSTNILIMLSFTLFLGFCFLLRKKFSHKIFIFTIIFFLIYFTVIVYLINGIKKTLVDTESPYSRIWVFEDTDKNNKKLRRLATDLFGLQGSMYSDDPAKLVHPYSKAYRIYQEYQPNPSSILMIGGGAYSFPKYLMKQHPTTKIDVVELDSHMTKIAFKYFGLENNGHLTIYHEDGRTYLNSNNKTYDIIFIDAIYSFTPPYYLTTVETDELISKSLSKNGIVVINIISPLEGPENLTFLAQYKTLGSIFKNIEIFPINKNNLTSRQNIIIVGLKGKVSNYQKKYDNELQSVISNRYEVKDKIILPILTDDYAPIERYTLPLIRKD